MKTRTRKQTINIQFIGDALQREFEKHKQKAKEFNKRKEELLSLIMKQENVSLEYAIHLYNVRKRINLEMLGVNLPNIA